MKGHIRKRGKDSWAAVIYVGTDASGKDRYKWHTAKDTKKQAGAKLAELLHSMNTGGYVEPAKMTFGQFSDRWLEDYAKTSVRPTTFELYKAIVKHHLKPRLGHIRLEKLKLLDLQNYYAVTLASGRVVDPEKSGEINKSLSPASVLKHHRMIHRALSHAVKWGLIARNVADAVDPPKAEKPSIHALGRDEVLRLLEARAKTDRYHLYLAAVTAGLRRGELLGLSWQDVDLEAGTIPVRQALEKSGNAPVFALPKSDRSVRRVALSPELVQMLRKHRAKQNEERLGIGKEYRDLGLVLTVLGGGPINPRNLNRQFKGLLTKAKLPETGRFHDLRHTQATLLLGQGVHPKIVSERLGHSSIGITMDIYSHVLPGM